jgi:hypothetical protein
LSVSGSRLWNSRLSSEVPQTFSPYLVRWSSCPLDTLAKLRRLGYTQECSNWSDDIVAGGFIVHIKTLTKVHPVRAQSGEEILDLFGQIIATLNALFSYLARLGFKDS